MALEIFWYDPFGQDCYPHNQARSKPDWAIELIRKEDYDKLIDLVRSHGLPLDQGGAYESRALDTGPRDEPSGAV